MKKLVKSMLITAALAAPLTVNAMDFQRSVDAIIARAASLTQGMDVHRALDAVVAQNKNVIQEYLNAQLPTTEQNCFDTAMAEIEIALSSDAELFRRINANVRRFDLGFKTMFGQIYWLMRIFGDDGLFIFYLRDNIEGQGGCRAGYEDRMILAFCQFIDANRRRN
jgi:hypothetical protein